MTDNFCFQCQSGHLLCDDCDGKSEVCPVCRCKLNRNKRIRCLAAEQVGNCCPRLTLTTNDAMSHSSQAIEALDFTSPCMNHGRGCKFVARGMEVRIHEKVCEFRLVPCPDYNCSRMVQFKNLLDHLVDNRPDKEIRHLSLRSGRAETITFNLDPDVWALNNTVPCVGKIFTYLGGNFILNFIKVDGTHYAWISVIGNSGMYSVDIKVNVGLLRVKT